MTPEQSPENPRPTSLDPQSNADWSDVVEPADSFEADYSLAPAPVRQLRQPLNRRTGIAAAAVGSLLLGGAVAVGSLGGPAPVAAQSGNTTSSGTTAADPSASPGASSAPSTGIPGFDGDPHYGFGGGFGGGLGPNHEAVSDTSVAAGAIGISESDLITALQGGQTMAQVAKAHNVDPQKVIDALVTDGLNELATAVKNGQLTQAQADAMKAGVTQRATDQVNGTFGMGWQR